MTPPAKAAVAGPQSVALIGPYGSGKSTLFEALMAAAGAPLKRQSDIRKRVVTTELRLGHCSFLADRWSILDCPGSVEFSYETEAALAAVDLAIAVCEPTAGRASSVPLLLKALEDFRLPHLIYVNKIDTLAGSFDDTLAALQAYSKYPLAARQLPIREGDAVTGYVDVVSGRAYRYGANQGAEPIEIPAQLRDPEKQALDGLAEVLADQDDALLEKLIEEIVPTSTELYQQLRKDQASGTIVEVLLGSAARGQGILPLGKRCGMTCRTRPKPPPIAASGLAKCRSFNLQDGAGGQAFLWPDLARRASRRRDVRRSARRRHSPLCWRRSGQGAGSRCGRVGRAWQARWGRDRGRSLESWAQQRHCPSQRPRPLSMRLR